MPFVYNDQLATAGNLTCSATANAETETCFLKPGTTRSLYLSYIKGSGKNAAKTQLDSIFIRTRKWGTASTGGTALSIVGTDASVPSTTITGASRPTSGTTATNAGPILGFGTTSWDLWQTANPNEMISLGASNAGSISLFDGAATGSLVFEVSLRHEEH